MCDMDSERQVELWRAGRKTWPSIPLPLETFVQWSTHDPELEHAGDFFLAVACLAGIDAASRELAERYRGDVEAVVGRLGLRPYREEILQRVLQLLLVGTGDRLPALSGYQGRGPLRSWLRVVAVRQAYDVARESSRQGRREVPRPTDDDILDQAVARQDPELAHLKSLYGGHVKAAFEEAFRGLDREDRQWLRFSFLEGLNLDELAAIFRTSRATAGRRRRRALDRLMTDTRRQLSATLEMTEGEMESVMNLVRSRLHLSLSRLLESSG